jgi:hypothetical protein
MASPFFSQQSFFHSMKHFCNLFELFIPIALAIVYVEGTPWLKSPNRFKKSNLTSPQRLIAFNSLDHKAHNKLLTE